MLKKPLLLTLLLSIGAAFAADPNALNLVTVDAVALAIAPPDRLEWRLEIKAIRPSIKESRAVVDASLNRLKTALKNAGVPDDSLAVSDVMQGREIEWNDRKRSFKGFFSSVQLKLSIKDLKLMAPVTSEILADDLIELESMTQHSDHEGELRQKALIDAALVAKKKAEVLAATLGAKVGNVIRITETSFSSSSSYGNSNSYINAAQTQSVYRGDRENQTAYVAEINVRASVNVIFELVK